MGVQLVTRSILRFSLIRFYKILLNTTVLPRNILDPKFFGSGPKIIFKNTIANELSVNFFQFGGRWRERQGERGGREGGGC